MNLTDKQIDIKAKITAVAKAIGMDPSWPIAVAMTESSLGIKQKSPTGCVGVFEMSSVAMKDLLQQMATIDDDWGDILCGMAFLRLLLTRHKTIEEATAHFCDPRDRDFYIERVKGYMEVFKANA